MLIIHVFCFILQFKKKLFGAGLWEPLMAVDNISSEVASSQLAYKD